MNEFNARIKPGTVRELRETEFAATASEAATLLVFDRQRKMDELKIRSLTK